MLLAATAALVLAGFIALAPRAAAAPPEGDDIPVPEPGDTPEEALKRDG